MSKPYPFAAGSSFFSKVEWSPFDIQELRPDWTAEECKAWLREHEQTIQHRTVEFGWTVIEDLLSETSK